MVVYVIEPKNINAKNKYDALVAELGKPANFDGEFANCNARISLAA